MIEFLMYLNRLSEYLAANTIAQEVLFNCSNVLRGTSTKMCMIWDSKG